MKGAEENTWISRSRTRLKELVSKQVLLEAEVSVRVGVLTPEEAIGSPIRQDFPILIGKERMVEARLFGARGHAFTDSPTEFVGTVREVLALPLDSNQHRAIFIAMLNAVLRHLDELEGTVHCKDEDPERCAAEIAAHIREQWGDPKVGLIGCNPAIVEALVKEFGPEMISLTDLDPDHIGTMKHGVEIWDGNTRTDDLVAGSTIVLLTGTTFVNGTFDDIWLSIDRHNKGYLIYGVTAAGICHLFGLNRICPYGQ